MLVGFDFDTGCFAKAHVHTQRSPPHRQFQTVAMISQKKINEAQRFAGAGRPTKCRLTDAYKRAHPPLHVKPRPNLCSCSMYIQAGTLLLPRAGIKALAQRDSFNYQVLSLCLWFQFLPAKLVMIFKMPAGKLRLLFLLSFLPTKKWIPQFMGLFVLQSLCKIFIRPKISLSLFFFPFLNMSLAGRNGNKGFGEREGRDQCRMY